MSSASGDGPSLSKAWPLGNEAFLRAVFEDRWEDAHVCAVAGDPTRANPADWAGGKARSWLRHLAARTNNYFAVSTFCGDRRIESAFAGLWVLGIDDVGPKINAQTVLNLLGEPTYRIETSPGNEQWGYRLAVPIIHVGRAKALQRAVRVALTGVDGRDPGQEHVTRYMRLPVGMNRKGSGSQVRQTQWSARLIPEAEVELWFEQLGVPGPDDPSWDKGVGTKVHRLAANSPDGPGRPGDVVLEEDLLLRAMRELDLVLGQARDSAMGTGFDVRCPWGHEHTDRGDTGTFFAPGRGFRCHHGHCDGKGIPDLPGRLDEMLREDTGGLVCLGALDFDEVDPASVPVARVAPPRRVVLDGKTYELTEDGLALAFVDEHAGRVRYDHTRKVWVLWDRGWQLDGTERAFSWVRELTRRLRLRNGDVREAKALSKVSVAAAIERVARTDQRVAATILSWDRDLFALAAAGVHVGLRDGAVRALAPGDMMTRSASVAPDPGMPTPFWDRFMWETFGGDIDLIEFMHQWFGYCLTGDVSAEMLVFLYGTGGNGKGVLLHTVSAIAGDYAVRVSTKMLMQRKFEEHETEVAQLCGARMVLGSEVDEHARWNLSRLKELSSKEGTLTGRFMRKDFFGFAPTHKLTIAGNHKPQIGSVDRALARRLVLVPFLHEPKTPDQSLKDRLVPEYPGILWKLIVGAGQALAAVSPGGVGLPGLVPQSVVHASSAYLVGQDEVALWMSERCDVVGGGVGVLCSEAHGDYETWCAAEGRTARVALRRFGDEVKRAAGIAGMPIDVQHRMKGSMLIGVVLKPPA
jgi:putative DNA primase/helicase